jgi:pSer/pThr/pTyr-binding forkhead associated (FHA) protein
MATVTIVEGPGAGQKFLLEQHRLVMIGRDASCTIQVVDPQLSRNHLQIKLAADGKRHLALDFNSKNGVFVNDRKVLAETLMADHDQIKIGDTLLVYHLDDDYDAKGIHDSLKRFGEGHVGTQTI